MSYDMKQKLPVRCLVYVIHLCKSGKHSEIVRYRVKWIELLTARTAQWFGWLRVSASKQKSLLRVKCMDMTKNSGLQRSPTCQRFRLWDPDGRGQIPKEWLSRKVFSTFWYRTSLVEDYPEQTKFRTGLNRWVPATDSDRTLSSIPRNLTASLHNRGRLAPSWQYTLIGHGDRMEAILRAAGSLVTH